MLNAEAKKNFCLCVLQTFPQCYLGSEDMVSNKISEEYSALYQQLNKQDISKEDWLNFIDEAEKKLKEITTFDFTNVNLNLLFCCTGIGLVMLCYRNCTEGSINRFRLFHFTGEAIALDKASRLLSHLKEIGNESTLINDTSSGTFRGHLNMEDQTICFDDKSPDTYTI